MELSRDGKEAKPAQRLTFDERVDWPTGWLQDGKTVLFYSDRAGSFDIYKQRIDQHDAEAIVTGPDDKRQPQLSPDGRWILYMQWPKTLDGNFAAGGKIMRVPVVGGAPEGALEIKSHPQVAAAVWVVFTAPGLPSFACARHAGGDCVFAEVDGNKIAFTLFDPVQGEKQRPLRVAVTSPDEVAWDLSPDGSHIAISNFDFKTAEVQIIPLAGGAPQKLSALPWTELSLVAWSADGRSLFLTSGSSKGTTLLHMNIGGAPEPLLTRTDDILSLCPSPDGRYLAFGPPLQSGNAWMLSNFPEK
jgi:Tol biopolymer transport system component